MELLILSKLKWDLTAVTAYDYLDHLLEALHRNSGEEGDTDSRLLESSHLESLRKQVIRTWLNITSIMLQSGAKICF